MKPFRLRLAAALIIVLGLIPFGFAFLISTWQRVDRDGDPSYIIPGNGAPSYVKAEIIPLLTQLGGGAIGVGIAVLILAQFVAARQKRALATGIPLPTRPPASPLRTVLILVFSVIVALVGTFGYQWYAYVTASETPYDEVGIEINSRMPDPIRHWGCVKLEARFPGALPPMGCSDASGTGWQ